MAYGTNKIQHKLPVGYESIIIESYPYFHLYKIS